MRMQEFIEQDNYCREYNTPKDTGCSDCPALDKEHCADALRNLCGRTIANLYNKPIFSELSKELETIYGLSRWNQLSLFQGEIEFPS